MSERHTTHVEESKKLCALKIRNAKRDDAGFYSVVVENPYGSDDSSAQVAIIGPEEPQKARIPSTSVPTPLARVPHAPLVEQQSERVMPPRIVKHMLPETQVTEGQSVVITCVVEGVPTPQITYLKNDQPMAASSRIKTSYIVSTGLVTVKLDDANVYDACAFKIRAENSFGRAETSGVIYVTPTSVIDARPVVDPNAFKYLPQQQQQPQQPHQQKRPSLTHVLPDTPAQPKQTPNEFMSPPNFIVGLPANIKLHEGEPIKLACQVEGHPKPSVSWLKDGKSLPASLRFNTDYVVPTGMATLTVAGALLTDCGNYTAVAENPAGKAYTTCQMFVKESGGIDTQPITNTDAFKYLNKPQLHGKYDSPDDSQTDDDVPLNRAKPPKVIHGLPNLKQLEGEPVVMACKIDGFPKPTLTWLKDGAPLLASNRFTTQYDINTGVARLKIADSILNDSGVYTVVADNKAGSDRTNGRLEIEKETGVDSKPIVNPNAFASLNRPHEQPRRESEEDLLRPARIVVPLQNLQLAEGKPCRLACRVEGFPKPSVVWYKNGATLPASNRFTPEYDLKTGVASLKFADTQSNDSGRYEVFAENKAGSDRTASSLIVTPSSVIDKTPIVDPRAFKYLDPTPRDSHRASGDDRERAESPRVVIPLKDYRVNEGQSVNLMTKITGYPQPRIIWLHNNQPLIESNRYVSSYDHTTNVASFKINGTQINDVGSYTAVAENKAGQAHTTGRLSLNQLSYVDTTPIVNPDAFKYLEKPQSDHYPHPRASESDDVPVSAIKPPKFIVPLTNIRADEGNSAQLTCKLEGYPFPTVSWFKDNRPLPASNRLLTNYNMNSGIVSLKIGDVQLGDHGNYTAFAQNRAGQDQTFGSLQVKQMPGVDNTSMVKPDAFRYLEAPKDAARKPDDRDRMNYKPPKFIIPLADIKINESQPAHLAAKVDGYPKPKVNI